MVRDLIQQLYLKGNLPDDDLLKIIEDIQDNDWQLLRELADKKRKEHYQDNVYMRGLIEFTSYCSQDCSYCGLRASNPRQDRYRLTLDDILQCCGTGYELGYRTFVLQGGEDPWFNDQRLIPIVAAIKKAYPDTALTLSVGERTRESYQKLYDAGADRYLLRHETASKTLYEALHPGMSFDNRMTCLKNLKEIGFQVGAGFMVGLPGQTNRDLVMDLRFLHDFQPHMIGIGPFIPHSETPLGNAEGGTVDKTLLMLSLVRLLVPAALMPATTALGTLDSKGREKAIQCGANVVMPNLSPTDLRPRYEIYENKICTGDEAAHCRACIEGRIKSAGYQVSMTRGDHYEHQR